MAGRDPTAWLAIGLMQLGAASVGFGLLLLLVLHLGVGVTLIGAGALCYVLGLLCELVAMRANRRG